MKPSLHTTAADKVLIVFTVILTAASFLMVPRWVLSAATDVEIRCGEKIVGTYPLHKDRVVEVPGPLGSTLVEIKSGRARVKSSPCPNGMCMHMGDLGNEGGCLVCLPNQVMVTLGKGPNNGLDAVTK